jgi:hypothetical protein
MKIEDLYDNVLGIGPPEAGKRRTSFDFLPLFLYDFGVFFIATIN